MSILPNKNSILELLLTDSMMQNKNGNVKWDNVEASNSYVIMFTFIYQQHLSATLNQNTPPENHFDKTKF
jgi:hypothetical protein